MCILTFNGPFTVTGNGFFGTWGATVCSLGLSYQTFFEKELPLGSSIRKSLSHYKPYGKIDEVSQSAVNPTMPSSGLPPA